MPHRALSEMWLSEMVRLLAELTTTPPALDKTAPTPRIVLLDTVHSRACVVSLPTNSTPDWPVSVNVDAATTTPVELLPTTTPQPATDMKVQFQSDTFFEFETATAASCGIPGSEGSACKLQ